MVKKIVVRGPSLSQSGYGVQTRFALSALRRFPNEFDIYLANTPWGGSGWIHEDNEERKWIDEILVKTHLAVQRGEKFDISLQITIPGEFQGLAPINVGYTAGTESTKISNQWMQILNQMNRVITTSNHAKFAMENTTYPELSPPKVKIPIIPVSYPVRKVEPKEIDLKLDHDFNFLVIGTWCPRKNLEETIKGFVEEFAGQDVGLIVKTSSINNCVRDRGFTENRLKNLLKDLNDRSCKVYLLHGDLSDEEMAGLYSHPKVKCLINLAHGEGFCGLDYTPIITQTGRRRLDEIKEGEMVLTHKNRFRKVLKTMNRDYEGEMVKIIPYSAQNVEPIILTPNHNVYVCDKNGKKSWKEAGQLSKNDYLVIPKIKWNKEINEINILDFIECGNVVLKDEKIHYKHSNGLGTSIANRLILNKAFGRLCGWFLAEGSVSNNEQITFSLHSNEEETYGKEIVSLISSLFGLNLYHIRRFDNKQCICLDFHSKIIASLLTSLCGNGAQEKKIHSLFFEANDEFKRAFISSLYEGDGWIGVNAKNPSIEIQLSNKNVLRDLRLLLLSYGIIGSYKNQIRKGMIKEKWNYESEIHDFVVGRQISINKLLDLIKENSDFCTKLNVCETNVRQGERIKEESENFVLRIKTIEKVYHNGKVFNLSVEEDETYCTDNFVVHNCLPIFEAISYGLPVIAPNWGGQTDFISMEKSVKVGKKKVKKNVCLISPVEFDIQPVQEAAYFENVIIPQSQWAFPKKWRYRVRMREMIRDYKKHLKNAKELQEHICAIFTEQKQCKQFVEAVLGHSVSDLTEISKDDLPKISIITSVFKGDKFIRSFLEDVSNQTVFKEKCELILVNEGSPDHEDEAIHEFQAKFPDNVIYIEADEDKGLYHAWNEALDRASGEFITNWNLDDRRATNSIERYAKELVLNKDVDFVYADTFISNVENETFETVSKNSQARRYVFEQFSPDAFLRGNQIHNVMFFRKSVVDKVGKFDDTFRSAADWEFALRAFVEHGLKAKKIEEVLNVYFWNPEGVSTDPKNNSWKQEEEIRIFSKYSKIFMEKRNAV